MGTAKSLCIYQAKQRCGGLICICLERAFCTGFAIEELSILTFELRVVLTIRMAAFPRLTAIAGVGSHVSDLRVHKYHQFRIAYELQFQDLLATGQ
jgi:hypothetical protein